jgi:Flp pilus assembly pilin Flp
MNLSKKLAEERGQGLVEYTFIVLFVALVLFCCLSALARGEGYQRR